MRVTYMSGNVNIKINNKKTAVQNLSPKTFFDTYLFENVKTKKKSKKIKEKEFVILKYDNYDMLLCRNYNVKQLKQMLKHYKWKTSGNKSQLLNRLYNYLKYSNYSIKIQKCIKGYFQRKYNRLKGPAFINRKCVNDTDFLTLVSLNKISPAQFFSYRDKDGFVYGFDVRSIFNLIKKNKEGTLIKNPYNRQRIKLRTRIMLRKMLRLGKILKDGHVTNLNNNLGFMSDKKKLEMKTLTVFQKMDLCGYNTDINWFLTLTKNRCIRYLKSLLDIWDYRSQIDEETKHKIYPGGNPFYRFNYIHQTSDQINERINNTMSFKNDILLLIDDLITKGQDDSFKNLGMIYVLGAFTIVNHNAAASLPWLYETFSLTH